VPFRLLAIGNVEAYSTVAVKARVDGQIVEVGFKEGEEVPRVACSSRSTRVPTKRHLRQAEANFLRDTSQKNQADHRSAATTELLAKNFVSKEAYAQIRTNAERPKPWPRGAAPRSTRNAEPGVLHDPLSDRTATPERFRFRWETRQGERYASPGRDQPGPSDLRELLSPEQQLRAFAATCPRGRSRSRRWRRARITPAASGTLVFVDNAVDRAPARFKCGRSSRTVKNALWPGHSST